MRCLKLPFAFSPELLRTDLTRVAPEEWIPHMQRRHYDGEWSGAALRSVGGTSGNIVPDARDGAEFRATALLGRCAYFREVLATFQCPLLAARLLRLHAGSSIAEHIDHALDFDDGEVRIHIPIVTSDEVKFYLDGSRLVMAPGECWYTNVNLPHSVDNRGMSDRIHLVIDCRVNDWLNELFATTPRPPRDHYAARLVTTDAIPIGPWLEILAASATSDVTFRTAGRTMVLQWTGARAWQFRLMLPVAAGDDGRWIARLESSPDPERHHRHDYAMFLDRCARFLPGLAIEHEGLA